MHQANSGQMSAPDASMRCVQSGSTVRPATVQRRADREHGVADPPLVRADERQRGRGDSEDVHECVPGRDVDRDVVEAIRVATPDQRAEDLEQRRHRDADPDLAPPLGGRAAHADAEHRERDDTEHELSAVGVEAAVRVQQQHRVARAGTAASGRAAASARLAPGRDTHHA